MSKKPTKPDGDAPKPITLIVTIYPPKKGQRHVMVSGAPEGEMPLIVEGLFPDRHALLDRAFAGVLKRDPQIVTIKADKPDKSKSITAGSDEDDEATFVTEPEETDQLVTDAELPSPMGEGQGEGESVPVSPITNTEELPAIDGDTATSEDVQRFEAALEELKDDTTAQDDDNG